MRGKVSVGVLSHCCLNPHVPCQPMQAVASILPMWLRKLAMTRLNGKESGIQEIHCKTMDLQHRIHRMLATICNRPGSGTGR
jgi:hypothetical protein